MNGVQQMQWDAHLIAGWKRDGFVSSTAGAFMAQHHLSLQAFIALKRTPRHSGQFYKPVRVFVAQALPWLSDRLWEGKHPADLVLMMDGTTLDTSVRGRPDRELNAAIRDTKRIRSVNQHRGHRRSDWHVCKG